MVKIGIPTSKNRVINLIIGFILGYLINWIWETYQLFGYKQKVLPLPNDQGVGVDDLIIIGIGLGVYFQVNKDVGLGILLAMAWDKIDEIINAPPTTVSNTTLTNYSGAIGI